ATCGVRQGGAWLRRGCPCRLYAPRESGLTHWFVQWEVENTTRVHNRPSIITYQYQPPTLAKAPIYLVSPYHMKQVRTLVDHEAQPVPVLLRCAVDNALRWQPVTPGAPRLLEVTLKALAEAEVYDVPHVCLVNAYSGVDRSAESVVREGGRGIIGTEGILVARGSAPNHCFASSTLPVLTHSKSNGGDHYRNLTVAPLVLNLEEESGER
ncbi:hypothetical protein Vretifemale_10117, partial [Volvox reticuliferus]